MPSWDPSQYLQFAAERARPFHDLLARVGARAPRSVVDLGCGPGTLTLDLARRWPGALVTGVDCSPAMIARARGHTLDMAAGPDGVDPGLPDGTPVAAGPGGRVEFLLGDLREVELPTDIGVLVSNATLQWVPDHLALLPGWVDRLASGSRGTGGRSAGEGGWLALQVPGNADAPEHRAVAELAQQPRYRAAAAAETERPVGAGPAEYLAVLARPAGVVVDVWETTYLHVLPGADPVLEWLRGTGARPVLDALARVDPDLALAYREDLRARLRLTHPRTDVGVVLPFRRVFAVAHRLPGRLSDLAHSPLPSPSPRPSL